jgi:hypothetical protein
LSLKSVGLRKIRIPEDMPNENERGKVNVRKRSKKRVTR